MVKQNYYRTLISVTTKEEAKTILRSLLEKRLIAGGMITEGESQHWWNNQVEEKIFYNLSAFTPAKNKQKIIEETKRLHKKEGKFLHLKTALKFMTHNSVII